MIDNTSSFWIFPHSLDHSYRQGVTTRKIRELSENPALGGVWNIILPKPINHSFLYFWVVRSACCLNFAGKQCSDPLNHAPTWAVYYTYVQTTPNSSEAFIVAWLVIYSTIEIITTSSPNTSTFTETLKHLIKRWTINLDYISDDGTTIHLKFIEPDPTLTSGVSPHLTSQSTPDQIPERKYRRRKSSYSRAISISSDSSSRAIRSSASFVLRPIIFFPFLSSLDKKGWRATRTSLSRIEISFNSLARMSEDELKSKNQLSISSWFKSQISFAELTRWVGPRQFEGWWPQRGL